GAGHIGRGSVANGHEEGDRSRYTGCIQTNRASRDKHMTTISHIVFDIGKVLIHYDPELPYLHIIEDNERRAWFLAEVCSPEWNVEQDRGREWHVAEAELIERHPQEANQIRAFRRHWHEMVPHAYDDSVAIMEG